MSRDHDQDRRRNVVVATSALHRERRRIVPRKIKTRAMRSRSRHIGSIKSVRKTMARMIVLPSFSASDDTPVISSERLPHHACDRRIPLQRGENFSPLASRLTRLFRVARAMPIDHRRAWRKLRKRRENTRVLARSAIRGSAPIRPRERDCRGPTEWRLGGGLVAARETGTGRVSAGWQGLAGASRPGSLGPKNADGAAPELHVRSGAAPPWVEAEVRRLFLLLRLALGLLFGLSLRCCHLAFLLATGSCIGQSNASSNKVKLT